MDRADRIGAWVSGIAHAALIAWVAVGGALFRGQPSASIRMTNVQTMSEADFQQMAAATRGAALVPLLTCHGSPAFTSRRTPSATGSFSMMRRSVT